MVPNNCNYVINYVGYKRNILRRFPSCHYLGPLFIINYQDFYLGCYMAYSLLSHNINIIKVLTRNHCQDLFSIL